MSHGKLLTFKVIQYRCRFSTKVTKVESSMGGNSVEFSVGRIQPILSQFPKSLLEIMGYPRHILKPDVSRLLELNKEACQVKADYILPNMNAEVLPFKIEPDELPKRLIEFGDRETMAYVVWQMPFTFGCLERIFSDIKERVQLFKPRSVFDFGTGPGTAILAAEHIWKESIERVHGVDISEPMLQMARKFWAGIPRFDTNVNVEVCRFLSLAAKPKQYDLSVSAFSLGDLPDDGVRKMTINALWEQTKDILVLVERGTPEGSRIISNARKQILCKEGYINEAGDTIDPSNRLDELHIISPCPHEKRCPMVGSWCHFSQRVEVTRFQMEAHHVGKGFVDQKFSYLVISRGPRPSLDDGNSTIHSQSFHWPRLIRRPLKRQGHIINDVCDNDSTFKRIIVPRSQGKQIYYDARKGKWGDLWPHAPKKEARMIETMKVKPKRFKSSPLVNGKKKEM